MSFNDKLTQQAIDKLLSTPACIESVRAIPCYDYKAIIPLGLIYEARFGAFVRVKCGIITLSAIDWSKVAQAMDAAL